MSVSVEAWLDERRSRFALGVTPTVLSRCAQWRLEGGELRHASGRFFQVIGAQAVTPAGEPWQAPLLRQEEVGLLAFLVRASPAGNEWLLQAKAEPGNVGGAQVAPTIQATESNFQRVHGGAATRFLEWFLTGTDEHVVADVLGSEIGTRFLGKRNRNALALVPPGRRVALGGAWRWFPSADVRHLLARDYVFGTEGRSVVVSAPWSVIADGLPFARWRGSAGFTGRLAASYASDPDASPVMAALDSARAAAPDSAREVALESLADWTLSERGLIASRAGAASVRFVDVVAVDREVRRWCQPLMARPGVATCDLVCQERDGLLRFLLRAAWEPGLTGRVELAPSRLADGQPRIGRRSGETTRLSLLQSDEGGRFLHCRTRYRIVERRSTRAEPAGHDEHWLTLAQLETLAHQPTTLTNEARTVLSLLLSMA